RSHFGPKPFPDVADEPAFTDVVEFHHYWRSAIFRTVFRREQSPPKLGEDLSRFKLFPKWPNSRVPASPHTTASAARRRRPGPFTTLRDLFPSNSAALKTLLMSSTKMNFISFRIDSFTSSRSRLFNEGIITVSIFARRAARTFSLIPPTGSTSPRNV